MNEDTQKSISEFGRCSLGGYSYCASDDSFRHFEIKVFNSHLSLMMNWVELYLSEAAHEK